MGVTGFVAARVAVLAIAATVSLVQAFALLPGYRARPNIHWRTLKSISGYLGTGISLRLMGFVAGGLDRTLIGAWVSVGSVAAYALQWSLISPTQSLLANTFNYLFPLASALQATGEHEKFKRIFFTSGQLYAAISCTAFGALFLFGTSFMRLWVSDAIAAQVLVVFPLLVSGSMIAQLGSHFVNTIVLGSGHLRLYSAFTIAKVILLGGALFLGVRHFSLPGAGAAYLVAGIAEIAYLILAVRSILHIPFSEFFFRAYARPVAVTALIVTIFWPLRHMASTWSLLAVSCGLFLAISGVGFILLRVIDPRYIAGIRKGGKAAFSEG
jgi:O-antigen/teichoic acid export membrane protein